MLLQTLALVQVSVVCVHQSSHTVYMSELSQKEPILKIGVSMLF